MNKSSMKKIIFQKCFDRNEILFKNDNLWISNKLNLMMKIIRNVHNQFFFTHSNVNKIEKFIKRYYYWFNMKLSIKRYIRNCYKCQRFKIFHDDRHKLLISLSFFNQRWMNISNNFIIILFDLRNNNAICIIIDRLTKENHHVFCVIDDDNLTIEICVKILLHYVFRIHDFFFIISNRDNQFLNRVWIFFCKRLKIKCRLFIVFQS